MASASAFADHLRGVIWLIPAMDGLFNGPGSGAEAVSGSYWRWRSTLSTTTASTRWNAPCAPATGLLEDPRPDPHWLDAAEHETAELAVAVAAGRAETVTRLQAALAARQRTVPPPPASLSMAGWKPWCAINRLVAVEDRYRKQLRENRSRDAAAGRTLDGPHLTDLLVTYAAKGISGCRCVNRRAEGAADRADPRPWRHLIAEMTGFAPILLLDEVVAPSRSSAARRLSTMSCEQLGAQVWMTQAPDPAAFRRDLAGQRSVSAVPFQGAAIRR